MANSHHLLILSQGFAIWNDWRDQNLEIIPNLSDADLYGINLGGVNLSGVNLSGVDFSMFRLDGLNLSKTNLSKADFTEANLSDTNLSDANLSNANLIEAILDGANLRNADLRKANLSQAKLQQTMLNGADLRHAILEGAELSYAVLTGADLSHAILQGANLRNADLSETKLSETNLIGTDLIQTDFRNANLSQAMFDGANLGDANLSKANLNKASFQYAVLTRANLSKTNLSHANLYGADLSETNLSEADLSGAVLSRATLIETNLKESILDGCRIYGISAWNLSLDGSSQSNLVVSGFYEPRLTVDNLEVAQFIYFLITNKNIRKVINTIANKAVLVLGRFTPKRKEILDAIAGKLRNLDLVPILFDFQKPEQQDIIETVKTLAGISRFIIADVTNARVTPDELRSIVPDFSVPVIPLFQPSKKEPKPYASLYTLLKYTWFFEPVLYNSKRHLIKILRDKVIEPAEAKRLELAHFK